MKSVMDKRVTADGAEKDDKMYSKEGKELKPIEPRDAKELRLIEEMMEKYPSLDFLMCMLLIQATPEQLDKIKNNTEERKLDTSCVIKQDFYVDEEINNLNNLVIT
tara:strand:+ start:1114 stop:1431 length:318 start_codon:yes stop_codon:yes gene_type:complete